MCDESLFPNLDNVTVLTPVNVYCPFLRVCLVAAFSVPLCVCVSAYVSHMYWPKQVLDEGGHCGVFAHYPNLGSEVCEWSAKVRAELKAEVKADSVAHDTSGKRARARVVPKCSPRPGGKAMKRLQ